MIISTNGCKPTPNSIAIPKDDPGIVAINIPSAFPLVRARERPLGCSNHNPASSYVIGPSIFTPNAKVMDYGTFCSRFPGTPPCLSGAKASVTTPIISNTVTYLLSGCPFLAGTRIGLGLRTSYIRVPKARSN